MSLGVLFEWRTLDLDGIAEYEGRDIDFPESSQVQTIKIFDTTSTTNRDEVLLRISAFGYEQTMDSRNVSGHEIPIVN